MRAKHTILSMQSINDVKHHDVIKVQTHTVKETSNNDNVFEGIGAIAGRCGDCLLLNRQGQKVPVLPDLIYRAISIQLTEHCDYRISQIADNHVEIAADSKMHGLLQNALNELFMQQGLSSVVFSFVDKPHWNTANKQRRVVNLCEF
jgi:hypothetical protein